MRYNHQHILFLFCFMAGGMLVACIQPIQFKVTDEDQQIVIYGRITTHPGPQYLRITQTQAFGDVRPAGVSGAEVILREDNGGTEAFTELERGLYATSGQMSAQAGHRYWIEIRMPDGRRILSQSETMPQIIPIDTIYWELRDKTLPRSAGLARFQKFIDVYFDTTIPEDAEGTFLRWEAEDAWSFTEKDSIDWPFDIPETCYLLGQKPNPQAIMLFDGNRHQSGPWRNQFLASRRIDSSFTERHIFLAFQYRMTEEAFTYWTNLDQIVNAQGSIFDRPPAPLPGNLYDPDRPNAQVLGFFEANAVDTAFSRIVATDFATEYVVRTYCYSFPWDVNPIYPSHCYNCQKIPGMIKERPYYWD